MAVLRGAWRKLAGLYTRSGRIATGAAAAASGPVAGVSAEIPKIYSNLQRNFHVVAKAG